jgi:hypothetical protein
MEQGNPNSLHLMEGCKRFHLPASGEGQCKKRMPMCNAFDRVEEILEHSRCGRGYATGHGGSSRVFGRLAAFFVQLAFFVQFAFFVQLIFIYCVFLYTVLFYILQI